MSNFSHRVVFAFALLGATSPAIAGPDWTEMPPGAGKTTGTAQVVTTNPVETISGILTGVALRGVESPDFEDMYRIYICDPVAFTARTDGGDLEGNSLATFNSQLWLFDHEGRGLIANNDTGVPGAPRPNGSFVRFPANDGTVPTIPGPGFYFLAISGFGRVPVSPAGPIFNIATQQEISGPDGPGGTLPITDWNGPGQVGSYLIALTGVCPTPGTGMAMLIGLAAAARRRRG